MRMLDAQAALSFVRGQTTHVEAQVWRKQYPEIMYPEFVPIDQSAHPWAKTVTYVSMDYTGRADWIHGLGDDFPFVDMSRAQFETPVAMAGIGYRYNLEEISQASWLGINLSAEGALASRDAYERHCEAVAFEGDAKKGFEGLINNASVSAADVADGEGAADTTWETKTVDEIVFDINDAISDVYTNSNTIELPDTVLLPVSSYNFIATKRLDATMTTTVLEHIQRVNLYAALTGRPLKIRALRQLETAGAGGTKRMVVYKRAPDVVKMHRPQPLRFLPVQGPYGLKYEVPAYYRVGGTDVRRPGAMAYRDHL